MGRPAAPRRRWLFRIAAVVLALAALEVTARLIDAALPERTLPTPADDFDREFVRGLREQRARAGEDLRMVAEDTRSWSLEPGSTHCMEGLVPLRINSLGMRGPELGHRAEGEVRLLSLGDSSGFGHGVAEQRVLTERAAVALGEAWSRPVRAVNGCTPGYDSTQSLETLRRFGEHVGPDWVVVSCLWSDVYAPGTAGDPRARPRRAVAALRHLATYRVLARWLAPWVRPRKVSWIASRQDLGEGSAGDGSRVDLATYVVNLRAIARLSSDLGARTAFLILPAPMDFDPAPPPAVVSEYRQGMRLVADETGEPLVDGPAHFREIGLGVEGFLDKVHPAVAGHAALGEALAGVLAAEPEPRRRPRGGSPTDEPLEPLPFETLVPGCRPDGGAAPRSGRQRAVKE